MIIIQTVTANVNDIVSVGVSADEPIAGVQFHVRYDPANLVFQRMVAVPGGPTPIYNASVPGDLNTVVSQATPLPIVDGRHGVCFIEFLVNGPSILSLTDIIGSSEQATQIPLTPVDGAVLLSGGTMLINFAWDNPNPVADLIQTDLFQGDGPDPVVNNFVSVVSVDPTLNAAQFDVPEDQGQVWFYVATRNLRGFSPPSNVLAINTDLPLPLTNLRFTLA